jgi:5-methylcytosine-specific restriction endonuclease McrA
MKVAQMVTLLHKQLKRLIKHSDVHAQQMETLHRDLMQNFEKHRYVAESPSTPTIPNGMKKVDYLLKIQKHKCEYCGNKMNKKNITKEHLIPKSKGGTNHIGNICLVCNACNQKAGNDMNDPRRLKTLKMRLTTDYWNISM